MINRYKRMIWWIKTRHRFYRGTKENVLFLDIDGVLCPISSIDLNSYSKQSISFINRLVRDHSLRVVLCTGRRQSERMFSMTIKGLEEAGLSGLSENDILLDDQFAYSRDYDAERSSDIFRFLQLNPQIDKFIIIDDQKRLYENVLGLNLFVVGPDNPKEGFIKSDFVRADAFLNEFQRKYHRWGKHS